MIFYDYNINFTQTAVWLAKKKAINGYRKKIDNTHRHKSKTKLPTFRDNPVPR